MITIFYKSSRVIESSIRPLPHNYCMLIVLDSLKHCLRLPSSHLSCRPVAPSPRRVPGIQTDPPPLSPLILVSFEQVIFGVTAPCSFDSYHFNLDLSELHCPLASHGTGKRI